MNSEVIFVIESKKKINRNNNNRGNHDGSEWFGPITTVCFVNNRLRVYYFALISHYIYVDVSLNNNKKYAAVISYCSITSFNNTVSVCRYACKTWLHQSSAPKTFFFVPISYRIERKIYIYIYRYLRFWVECHTSMKVKRSVNLRDNIKCSGKNRIIFK